ncbi:MAG: N-6 DNA methylase [Planctomycetes bacterium]|nr:N-6 DNA methylase [Planctomycetota bacterium]
MKTTKDDLANLLWSALDASRGSQGRYEAVANLLALLVLKRVSDTSDEADGEPFLSLPPDARWSALRMADPGGLPEAIHTLAVALETANSSLPQGLLSDLDHGTRRTRSTRNAGLDRLVALLSGVRLGSQDVEPDALGEACDSLLQRLVATSGKSRGISHTPPDLRDLVVSLLDPKAGASVCDPACGAASFLTGVAKHTAQRDPVAGSALFGQEKSRESWRLANLSLLLHGHAHATVEFGDTLRDPPLSSDGSLRRFDAILSAPPLGLGHWGHKEAEFDPHGRFRYGMPPARTGDYAFVQHALASLNAGGRAVLVVAPGVLFRGGGEKSIREGLIKDDRIEAVVSLGPNLLYATGIPVAILVLAEDKEAKKRRKTLFINASDRFEDVRGRNLLAPKHREAIVGAYRSFANERGFARVVETSEIEGNDFSLDVKRYVQLPLGEEECLDLVSLRQQVDDLERRRAEVLERMSALLLKVGGSHGA